MQTEQKAPETPAKKNRGGRPACYSPKTTQAKTGITVTVEGDEVVIRMPKKDLSRKLLADLI